MSQFTVAVSLGGGRDMHGKQPGIFFSLFFHLKTCRDLIQTSLAAENKADQSCSPRGGCQAVAVAKRFAARIRFST